MNNNAYLSIEVINKFFDKAIPELTELDNDTY